MLAEAQLRRLVRAELLVEGKAADYRHALGMAEVHAEKVMKLLETGAATGYMYGGPSKTHQKLASLAEKLHSALVAAVQFQEDLEDEKMRDRA